MTSTFDVFQRTEKKYRLSLQQRAALSPLLDAHMVPDRFGKSTITSLYLDTPTNDLICRSLEKPLYKEKLRIRSYGNLNTMTGNNNVFIEIKKKYKGVVYKRRVSLTWDAARAFLGGMDFTQACTRFPLEDPVKAQESISPRSIQIAREIVAFAQRYPQLEPSMALSCERTALCLREDPTAVFATSAPKQAATALSGQGQLRITFDDAIQYCNLREQENGFRVQRPLLPQGESIMEIKIVGAMPLWLSRGLAQCGIKPTSFSKYGEAHKAVCA